MRQVQSQFAQQPSARSRRGLRDWIYYLAVDESHRDIGLGRQLMTSAETLLQEHGAVKVQLTIRSSKAAVLSFYDRLGYQDAQVQVRSKWLKP